MDERHTGETLSRKRFADRGLVLLTAVVGIGAQAYLRGFGSCETLSDDVYRRLYAIVAVGAMALVTNVLKTTRSIVMAVIYLCYYGLFTFWLMPHDTLTHMANLYVLWVILFTLVFIASVWCDCIPLFGEGPTHDFDQIVHSGLNITRFALQRGIVTLDDIAPDDSSRSGNEPPDDQWQPPHTSTGSSSSGLYSRTRHRYNDGNEDLGFENPQ